MPDDRHVPRRSFSRRAARAACALGGMLAVCAALLPGTAQASQQGNPPTLSQTLAEASKLSNQIDILGQQYDNLRIQLGQAQAEAAIARENAVRDGQLLAKYQAYIDDIAVEGYMTGGLSPELQLLQSANPQSLLDRASIMTQLQQENGAKVTLVATAATSAKRAVAAANALEEKARKLSAAMAAEVAQIRQKENFFNSQAFAQAAAIFQQTGHYPNIHPTGDSIGVQALRFALTRIGYPYVWAAAGPTAFDCSGLVVWAYAQVGISLMHYTGDLWNEGQHVSRNELAPGDLVFFYSLGHVGLYIGNGLMVNAPTAGQNVQVAPMDWGGYDGAVRIVA